MADIDANKEIRRAVDTGRVVFGTKQSEKSILNAIKVLLSKKTKRQFWVTFAAMRSRFERLSVFHCVLVFKDTHFLYPNKPFCGLSTHRCAKSRMRDFVLILLNAMEDMTKPNA